MQSAPSTTFRFIRLWSKVGRFACVLFSRDGKLIWTAQKLDENHLQILVYLSEDGTLLHTHEMEDLLSECSTNDGYTCLGFRNA